MTRHGAVVRDGDRFRAVLDIGAPGGKRRQKKRSVSIEDPADPTSVERARVKAERLLEELRADYATLTEDVKSLAQLLALWMDDIGQRLADGEIEHSTWSNYERNVRLHILPYLGRQPLGRLSTADVLAWQRQLARAGRDGEPTSAAMRAKALQTLKTALRWGLRMQLVATNPAEPVDPPRTKGDHGRAASLQEIRRLLDKPDGYRWLYTVLAGLGLRIGEGLGLTWGAVDLEARVVRIGFQVQREPERPGEPSVWVHRLPKGRKVRVVPLPRFVADALHEQGLLQAAQRATCEAVGLPWNDQWGLVFTGPQGDPLHASAINRSLRRACTELRLAPLTPHDLRRSCSSLLAARGVSTRVRMAILGHATARLTEDIYTRAYDPDVRAAMDALDEVMTGDA